MQLDELYEARYAILDLLSGSAGSTEISFYIADHHGFPQFAQYQHALLFVDQSTDKKWLEKYQGYAVHRTTNNSWASCGNPYDDRVSKEPRHLQNISFANDLGIVGEFSKDGIATRFFDEKYTAVVGDRMKCRKGVYVSYLYEMVRTGVMSARGITLPELPGH